VQNPAYWGPKSRHGKPLSEQQQLQYKAHAAAAAANGSAVSGSAGSNGRPKGGAGLADEGELDALYGGGGGGGGAANGSGSGGSGGGAAGDDGAEQQQRARRKQGAAAAVTERGSEGEGEAGAREPATKRRRN
jgi:hypothetical protein